MDFHKGILKPEKEKDHVAQPVAPQNRLPPLMPERDRERERDRDRDKDKDRERDRERDRGAAGVRDLWAEREREMQRRERARGEREWDRDKIREFARPGEEGRRSRSRDRERRRRERAKSKERKTEKKGNAPVHKSNNSVYCYVSRLLGSLVYFCYNNIDFYSFYSISFVFQKADIYN